MRLALSHFSGKEREALSSEDVCPCGSAYSRAVDVNTEQPPPTVPASFTFVLGQSPMSWDALQNAH